MGLFGPVLLTVNAKAHWRSAMVKLLRWAEKRIGPERIKTTYAFADLLNAGARLSFGSDWTVAPINPLDGIYAAVTRRTIDGANPDGWVPEQKISLNDALRAYTVTNAFAGYQEDRLGSLEIGKLADFVVLSRRFIRTSAGEFAKCLCGQNRYWRGSKIPSAIKAFTQA